MLFTIDVGNTRTCIGAFDGDTLKKVWSVRTVKEDTADVLEVKLISLLQAHNLEFANLDAVSLSCVVPNLISEWEAMLESKKIKCALCSPANASKLPSEVYHPDVENPAEVGSDYIAACIAAKSLTDNPAIIFDFGTATNAAVIDKRGYFIGGVIVPGMETSLNSLIAGASALHDIALAVPSSAIGSNTETCIQSGIVFGEAARAEGLVSRIENELGYDLEIFLTGGLSGLIAPTIKRPVHHDQNLLHYGLKLFFENFS